MNNHLINKWNKHCWLISLLVIISAIFFAFSAQLPSAQDYQSDNPKEFSQKNALKHLKVITEKPHYVGSPAHAEVRNYLIEQLEQLGLTVDSFEYQGLHSRGYMAAKTNNIIARISGSSNSKALALVSHYDSRNHSSLGASDAGSGVVTILEGIRAFLANNNPPKNDIIIIFTDAEELGLLGAQAFVSQHPWAKDIGLVLNFEARGSGGPSYMLIETNGGNENLIKAFSEADIEYPVANSLMYALYKSLPNDTDLTVFREQGDIEGFNFAFIDDHFDYHTVQDSYQRLDRQSLNHQADYLMATLNYFSLADLTQVKSERDMVYFNFPSVGMVIYPNTWVMPMVIIAALLLALLTYIGLKRNSLSAKGLMIGFVPLILSLLVAGLIGYLGWQAMLKLFLQYADIKQGFTYNGHWIVAGFVTLTCSTILAIYRRFSKKHSSNNLFFAPITLWLVINFAIAFKLPGAGFFIIPVYFALATFYFNLVNKDLTLNKLLLPTLLALPLVMLFTPLVPLFVVGLGMKMLLVGTIFSCLILLLMVPIFCNHSCLNQLTNAVLALSLILLLVSAYQSDYTSERKKPNSVNYFYDQDSNAAFLFSYNQSTDNFINQFFEQPAQTPWNTTLYPASYSHKINYHRPTDKLPLLSAIIEVTRDEFINEQRRISLRITPRRATNIIRLASNDTFKINKILINNQVFTNKDGVMSSDVNTGFFFQYDLSTPNEEITVDLIVPKESKLSLKLYEISFDLFENIEGIKSRSALHMPDPSVISDATIIGQTVTLN